MVTVMREALVTVLQHVLMNQHRNAETLMDTVSMNWGRIPVNLGVR